jgi:hypothetical protein
MSRRVAPLQVNQFIGGLITESSPLNTPLEVSIDETNMPMQRDGSRKKRLGFDVEDDYEEILTTVYYQSDKTLANQLFRWENVGGDPEKLLFVVQMGHELYIFETNGNSLSEGLIYTRSFSNSLYEKDFSFTVVDGTLVLVNSLKDVYLYTYSAGTITETTETLLVRDLFGVEVNLDSVELTDPQYHSYRPTTLNDTHTYNLRNQTFAIPRKNKNSEQLADPIASFYNASGNEKYPANSDSVNYFLYPDANDGDDRITERFFSNIAFENPVGSTPAPKGYFIIDALERGTSRLSQENILFNNYPPITERTRSLTFDVLRDNQEGTFGVTLNNTTVKSTGLIFTVDSLPVDRTPGGASCVTEFAGRVWYAGFSGQVEGGDSRSPRMSSYILFSLLVNSKSDITKCYQVADPTSNIDSSLVETDGGFIRVDDAYNIRKLVSLAGSLFVFAENGVWRITGEDNARFTAVNYQTDVLSKIGCASAGSVVVVDEAIFYWADDGIYVISQDQYGTWKTQNITQKTIQTYFLSISQERREACKGYFDVFQRTVRWVYNTPGSDEINKELLFDVDFKSFTPNEVSSEQDRYIVSINKTDPFNSTPIQFPVTVDGEVVTVDGDEVYVLGEVITNFLSESIYLTVTQSSPIIKFTFGTYKNSNHYDWSNFGTDIDYDAYLVTGFITTGEPESRKQAPYLYTFFERTELGFEGDFTPINQSSCLLSTRFEWNNTSTGHKWTPSRQIYRYNKTYIPVDASDTFDTGQSMIITKNKIRGFGKSVSYRFEGEPGKDLHIYGWSFRLTGSNEE